MFFVNYPAVQIERSHGKVQNLVETKTKAIFDSGVKFISSQRYQQAEKEFSCSVLLKEASIKL